MLPVRTSRFGPSGQTQSYSTSSFVDANFQATAASARPPSYPYAVMFDAHGPDRVWWSFVDSQHGPSPYIAWTNAPTIITKARNVVSRAVDPSSRTYDGTQAGPMGNETVPVIDDAFLRLLWVWLKQRQAAGVRVITDNDISAVAQAARTRSLPITLVRPLIEAAFHSGGVTGGSRFTLVRPKDLFVVVAGGMPTYGVPLGTFDNPVQAKAFLNNLGNLPRSGINDLDQLRVGDAPSPTPSSPAPAQPTQVPPVQSPPTTTQPRDRSVLYAEATPILDSFGRVVGYSNDPPATTRDVAQNPQDSTHGGGGTSAIAPVQPQGSSATPASLAGSLVDVAKKGWPYLVGGVGVVAVGGLGYWAYTKYRGEQ